MKRPYRWRRAPIVVLAAVALFTPSPAHAAPSIGAGVAQGGGTLSPGLTTTPTMQTSHNWSGTAVAAFTVVSPSNVARAAAATMVCAFNGASSIPSTIVMGMGTGAISCSGTAIAVDAVPPAAGSTTASMNCPTASYTTVGVVNILTANCGLSIGGLGTASGLFVLACLGEATNPPPITTYQAQCVFALASVA